LRAYAESLRVTQQYLSQLRDTAEIAIHLKPTSQLGDFLDKAEHLAAVHKAPPAARPLATWKVAGPLKTPCLRVNIG
jgi:hypothetical protein